MKNFIPFMGLLFLCLNSASAQENWSSNRPDGHAPITVMGDHYHGKGEVMFSYRFMPMYMKGMLQSSNEVGDETVFQDYMAAPQEMNMNMHMLGAMYAVSDKVTLMTMLNYTSNEMKLRSKMGANFTTESSGFNDISIAGLVKLMNRERQSIHATVGLSLPVGNISQKDDTPMMTDAVLAYPMQMGSGTFDPTLGLTYLGQSDTFSWGLQPKFKFRIGENNENYSLGNRFDAVAWGAVKASDLISFSTSLSYFNTGKIDGEDTRLHKMMMPLFDAQNSGRSELDLGIGSNLYISTGALKNLRFGVEVKIPVYQDVNGLQMKNKLNGMLGLQYSFATQD